jgi:membrane protein implicated in regulation of membrane protease activity
MLNAMHPARLTALILLGLAFLMVIALLIYGAVTTNENLNWAVAWSFPIASLVFTAGALICLIVSKRQTKRNSEDPLDDEA